MADLLELILITVHDSDSQDELLCIVVIENAVQVISKTLKKKNKTIQNRMLFNRKTLIFFINANCIHVDITHLR